MTEVLPHVIRLVTDDELLLNLGTENGVSVGDEFSVLDRATLNVHDAGQDYGSIERIKAIVRVVQVNEKMALARVLNRARPISSIASVMSGGPTRSTRLTSGTWPEGVEAKDPVVPNPI